MKALEKDRTRRYETPGAMADDVRRHLANEPTRAGAPSTWHRMGKFVLRHRIAVLSASAVFAAVLIGLAVSIVGLRRASKEAAHSRAIAEFLATSDPEAVLSGDVDAARIIARAHELFGADLDAVASTLFSRALELHSAGRFSASEPLLRESLRIWRQRHGDEHLLVGIALGKIGTLLMAKGDDRGAERALRESVRITRGLPGQEHMAQSQSMFELAVLLQNRREFDDAIELMAEAVRIRRAATPDQKTQIAIMVSAQANLLAIAGRVDLIEPVLLETLATWREAVPADSPLLAKVLVQVSAFFIETKQLAKAEELLREALEVCRGRDDSFYYRDVGLVLLWRAVSRQDDQSKEYLQKRREFVALARGLLDPKSQMMGKVLAEHATLMCSRGDCDTAFDWAIESLGVLELTGRERRYVDQSIGTIESVLKAADKQAAAQPLIESLRETPADAELHSRIRALLEEPK